MKYRFILYSRTGCHLCDEMYAELHTLGAGDDFLVEVVNIDNDPALVHRYGARIPVLVSVHDDSIISEHFLDKQAFLQALA